MFELAQSSQSSQPGHFGVPLLTTINVAFEGPVPNMLKDVSQRGRMRESKEIHMASGRKTSRFQ